jgi:hypothetical protein
MSLGTLFYFFQDKPSENSEGQCCKKKISIAQLWYLFQKRFCAAPSLKYKIIIFPSLLNFWNKYSFIILISKEILFDPPKKTFF